MWTVDGRAFQNMGLVLEVLQNTFFRRKQTCDAFAVEIKCSVETLGEVFRMFDVPVLETGFKIDRFSMGEGIPEENPVVVVVNCGVWVFERLGLLKEHIPTDHFRGSQMLE